MDTTSSNKFLLPVAVIIAGLLVAGAVVWNSSNPGPGTADTASVDIEDVRTEGEPYIGDPNAPVTIAFWSDFQCPFCKAFEVGHPEIPTPPAFPDIVREYVDTGKVKLVFKDVVFLSPRMGQDSLTGALYNQAVWKLYPEKYLEWRTAMMSAQDEEGGGFGNAQSIDSLNATIPGLDAARIAADVNANRAAYERHAQEVTAEAQRLGVNATPSLIIGDELIAGAYPYASFKTALDTVVK
ncbi:thioredoxin domain-containing protein [Candidatus Kaiserbacteria bacterium]|nr:thioredoxin domain-containing protein [Candidatus Kaiserbacteria bacterium]